MKVTKPSDVEIVLTRTFAAPRPAVFAALTQPEHLLRWLGTKEMTLGACVVDLRVGGALRYVFRRGRRDLEVRGVFTAVDPPERLAYTESYGFSPLVVQVATTLEEVAGGTRFVQTLTYASKAERDGDFDPVATSATESYARLESHLAQNRR